MQRAESGSSFAQESESTHAVSSLASAKEMEEEVAKDEWWLILGRSMSKKITRENSPDWPAHRARPPHSPESPPPWTASSRPPQLPPISPCRPICRPWRLGKTIRPKLIRLARANARAHRNQPGRKLEGTMKQCRTRVGAMNPITMINC